MKEVAADLAAKAPPPEQARRRVARHRVDAAKGQCDCSGRVPRFREHGAQQKPDVLNGCYPIILDLLPPEPAPTSPFEVMVVGRIRKAGLNQMLPAF